MAGQRPSGLAVVIAFAVAIAAAVALIVLAVVARDDDVDSTAAPTPVVDLSGIAQDGTVLGSPDARVRLIEYADLQCPSCRAYTELLFPTLVEDYVRAGRVKTEFRGLAFLGSDSEKALRYVLAAGLQDRLWDYQEALYRNQGAENSGWVTDELLRELAVEVGLDADRLFADAERDEVAAMIEETAAQAEADEVGGTPALFVQIGDAEPYFVDVRSAPALAAALDDALAG
jgi:protein-disulfide isomerase